MRHWDGQQWSGHTAPTGSVAAAQPSGTLVPSEPSKVAMDDLVDDQGTREWAEQSNRVLLLGASAVVVLLLVVGGVIVASRLANPPVVDIPTVKREIQKSVEDQVDADVKVQCPSSIKWKTGGTFHCIVSDDTGTQRTATVSMENDEGDITWRLE